MGHEETLSDDACVYYLDCSDGFMSIYICQSLSKHELQIMCSVEYVSDGSIKQLKQQANPSHPVSECQSLGWEHGEGAQIQWELPWPRCRVDWGGARRGSRWSH